jgi:hypothetical protein
MGALEFGTGVFYTVLTSFRVNAQRFRRFLCHLKWEMPFAMIKTFLSPQISLIMAKGCKARLKLGLKSKLSFQNPSFNQLTHCSDRGQYLILSF